MLATYPAVPPFPEFTSFERKALEVISAHFGSDIDAFRRQIEAARVIDRVNTVVGFYTRVVVDRTATRPLSMNKMGAHFEVPGVEAGVLVMLWEDDGYLSQIEGVTYGGEDLGQDLVDLDFTSSQLT